MLAGYRKRWAVLGACLCCGAAGFASAGCSGSREGQTVRLIASPKPYESDIPIPEGFQILETAMEDHSTGQARTYLRHSYVGGDDKFAVRNFYREQMPLSRWSLVSDSAIKGDFSMRFQKGNEGCVVNIEDDGKPIGRKTTVQVMISPEKKGAQAPASRKER